jgi:DNA-binding transcriptional LysR family regulator
MSDVIAPRLTELERRHPGLCIELIGEPRAVSLSQREADIATGYRYGCAAAREARRSSLTMSTP